MSWAEVKNLKDKMSDIANSTLHIEGGTDLAGQEVIIKRYDSDYMKATLDSTGSLEVEVTPKSKYRVTSNDADLSKRSQDIEVGTGDLVNVELSYRKYIGKDVLPVDDVPTWLACHPTAGSYKYTTLTQVLADTACLTALLSNQNSLDYLMRSKTLFEQLVDNKAAATLFSSITLANHALRDTPDRIVGIMESPNIAEIFPWSMPRSITNGQDWNLSEGLVGSVTAGTGANSSEYASLAYNAEPYHPTLDTQYCRHTANRQTASHQLVHPVGQVPLYKYVPKLLIFTAPSCITNDLTVSISGRRYDTNEWETLGSGKLTTSKVRVVTSIASNDKEYYEFAIDFSGGFSNSAGWYASIGDVNMVGYRYAYKDGREVL